MVSHSVPGREMDPGSRTDVLEFSLSTAINAYFRMPRMHTVASHNVGTFVSHAGAIRGEIFELRRHAQDFK
jgi:hypothetical protein